MTKFVHISDIHCCDIDPPPGDCLLITGDMTYIGSFSEMNWFRNWLKSIRDRYDQVIWICGNHERDINKTPGIIQDIASHTNSIYLQDTWVTYKGLKIFGSPYTPKFGNWGYQYYRDTNRWKLLIPDFIDIILTHGPPKGILDECPDGFKAGCKDLLDRIGEVKPKYVCFGHIHGGYGRYEDLNGTVYLNSSICTEMYYPLNKPQVFDIETSA